MFFLRLVEATTALVMANFAHSKPVLRPRTGRCDVCRLRCAQQNPSEVELEVKASRGLCRGWVRNQPRPHQPSEPGGLSTTSFGTVDCTTTTSSFGTSGPAGITRPKPPAPLPLTQMKTATRSFAARLKPLSPRNLLASTRSPKRPSPSHARPLQRRLRRHQRWQLARGLRPSGRAGCHQLWRRALAQQQAVCFTANGRGSQEDTSTHSHARTTHRATAHILRHTRRVAVAPRHHQLERLGIVRRERARRRLVEDPRRNLAQPRRREGRWRPRRPQCRAPSPPICPSRILLADAARRATTSFAPAITGRRG